MKYLRFSYVVLAICAGLVVYGFVVGLDRTSALFLEVREATGLVDAGDAFPTTPTVGPTTVPTVVGPTVAPTTPVGTQTVVRTPGAGATPVRTRTPARTTTAAASATGAAATVPPNTTQVPGTVAAETAEPVETSEPEQVVAEPSLEPEAEDTSEPEVRAEPTVQEPTIASSVPTTPPVAGASAVAPPATRVAVVAGEAATPPTGQAPAGDCPGGTATLTFGDDASYSGPGPFNAFVLVKNAGAAHARDVVLAFTVIEGGEFFHEGVFGNGQLWWAHGQPDAGIIHVVPEIEASGDAGVRLVATMGPEWPAGGRTVIRVTVVGAVCAAPSSDEALLTLAAAGGVADATPSVGPTRTATPIKQATAVSTVLGVEENPTSAPRPTETPLPEGQILPGAGDGSGDAGSAAMLVLAGVAVALVFLAVGVVAGRLLPRG